MENGWLKAARLLTNSGRLVCSLGMQELHVRLVSAFETG
ncbi:racemase [Salmonella enterica]|uniref:Racemase n=1 Tax=Salmonella typhimurium TaxID=90371 RepID=A0A5U8V8B5_SALTM|nr:racemase [Salmonella enterica]EAZ9875438.1 racemase [Salmonella enterica subsp. enterica serovar Typhimurium]EAR3607429.1 racemase [Salmonella enterica]EBM6965607.1 racemase [Salmonella enterica]EBO1077957.1 racemase [Salmonella enterica]